MYMRIPTLQRHSPLLFYLPLGLKEGLKASLDLQYQNELNIFAVLRIVHISDSTEADWSKYVLIHCDDTKIRKRFAEADAGSRLMMLNRLPIVVYLNNYDFCWRNKLE